MIQSEEKPDATPICPHCEAAQHTIHYRALKARFGRRYVYFCASCRKILGISQRKGFWMG